MKTKKMHLAVLCAVFAAATLLIFSGGATSANAQGQKTIGVAMHFLQDDWSLSMKRGVEDAAKRLGYKLLITDANFDPAKQLEQVESLITRKVNALVVIHLNTEEILPVLDKAKSRGIGVVGVGMPADVFYDKKYLSNLWTDNHIMGVLSGRCMADMLASKGKTDAKIAVIDAPIGMYALKLRVRGFKFSTIEEYPGMSIVAEEKVGTIEDAVRVTENLFTANPDLDAIYCTHSTALIGAARAKQAKNKTDIVLTGVDSDKEVCKFVKLGIIDGAAVNNSYPFGVKAVEIAHEWLTSKKSMKLPYYIYGPLLDINSVEQVYKDLYGEPLSKYMGD